MANLPLYQVDAFTDRVFSGNPAAVVPLPAFLADDVLQSIAAENNLSETAFVVVNGPGKFSIRWFTPTAEVRLCGHATLAAAHVINRSSEKIDKFSFKTKEAGTLTVKALGDNRYQMDLPADAPRKIRDKFGLKDIIGVKKFVGLYRGKDDLLVVLRTQKQIERLDLDMTALAELTQFRGLIVSAPGRDHDFVSRGFFPQTGIDEDPVTGSAHCLLVPYWSSRLGRKKLTARQLSARGGELRCQLRGQKVRLTGSAATYLSGQIYLKGVKL